MVQIVVISHGPLAQALAATAFSLVGPQANVVALGLGEDESPETFAARLRASMAGGVDDELLLLCDLRGGTPHRLALALARQPSTERDCAVVSDTTLGLLCEALVRRAAARSLGELAAHLARVAAEPVQIWMRKDVDTE